MTSLSQDLRAAIYHPGRTLCSLQGHSQTGNTCEFHLPGTDQFSSSVRISMQGWRDRNHDNQPPRGSDASPQTSATSSSNGTIIHSCQFSQGPGGAWRGCCLHSSVPNAPRVLTLLLREKAEATERVGDLLQVTAPSQRHVTGLREY